MVLVLVTLSAHSKAISYGSEPDGKKRAATTKSAESLSVEWKNEHLQVNNATCSMATLKIFNLQGELIEYQKVSQDNQGSLDVKLKPGTYYYSIRNSDGTHREGSFRIKPQQA